MSEKPPYQKMRIKAGTTVRFINPPPDVEKLLGGLPEDISVQSIQSSPVDTILLFANNRKELAEHLPVWSRVVSYDTDLWVLYHKGTSKIKTDIHRDSINDYAKSLGLQGVFMISINDDWSALRLKNQ
ncbi:MAG: DUF3052 family protein [Chloroflexi bacterium]|nr:MAG: DUF3052 family protein [Chloroflexota bacterium]